MKVGFQKQIQFTWEKIRVMHATLSRAGRTKVKNLKGKAEVKKQTRSKFKADKGKKHRTLSTSCKAIFLEVSLLKRVLK